LHRGVIAALDDQAIKQILDRNRHLGVDENLKLELACSPLRLITPRTASYPPLIQSIRHSFSELEHHQPDLVIYSKGHLSVPLLALCLQKYIM
jgi:hypothetical protein